MGDAHTLRLSDGNMQAQRNTSIFHKSRLQKASKSMISYGKTTLLCMSGLTRLRRPQSAGTTPQLPHFMQTRPKPGGCSSPFRGDFSQHEPQVWQGSDHGHPSPAFWAIACPGSKATVMQPFLSWGNCISQQVQSAHQMNIFVLHHWSILPNAEVCGRN